jgi:hypothetical protein
MIVVVGAIRGTHVAQVTDRLAPRKRAQMRAAFGEGPPLDVYRNDLYRKLCRFALRTSYRAMYLLVSVTAAPLIA